MSRNYGEQRERAMLFREEDEDLELLPFKDRAEAGRLLAGKLSGYLGRKDVIVKPHLIQ